MDNCRLIIDDKEITGYIQILNFICSEYAKGSLMDLDTTKYRLLRDLKLVAEEIED